MWNSLDIAPRDGTPIEIECRYSSNSPWRGIFRWIEAADMVPGLAGKWRRLDTGYAKGITPQALDCSVWRPA